MNLSIIILAAGQSSRLGQPKQLLPYQKSTLIEHIIEQTKTVNATKTIVVLGAFANQIQPLLASANVEVILNEDWKRGMSKSLQKGLTQAQNSDAILILLSDQPFVNTELINQIIQKATSSDSPIIATKYNHILGVPALFKKETFQELMALNEQQGAKKVIKKYAVNNQVGIVDFEKGWIDIDTMEDYEKLINSKT
jgi:molybdenum cofactor cytidylyltransferase